MADAAQSQEPDDSEPTPERQAELQAAYDDNVTAGRAPYGGVAIRTRGELSWVMRERHWSGEPRSEEGKDAANLRDATLSRANLSGADLTWANLSGANLSLANLSGTNLGAVNLSSALLRRANLSDANLNLVDLQTSALATQARGYTNQRDECDPDSPLRGLRGVSKELRACTATTTAARALWSSREPIPRAVYARIPAPETRPSGN